MPRKILIVDQYPDVIQALREPLADMGFEAIAAEDGAVGLAKAQIEKPSLILLDSTLPNIPGIELCVLLKQGISTAHIPTILLSANATEVDRIVGFEAGADDYIAKPFHPREAVLRIRNSIRRNLEEPPAEEKLSFGDLVLDRAQFAMTILNRPVPVTVLEFKLLVFLIHHRGEVIKRDRLLNAVWGQTGSTLTRTIDTHMTRLRNKLGPMAGHIETVRGVGYRLAENIPTSASLRRRGSTEVRRRGVGNFHLERKTNRKITFARRRKRQAVMAMA